VAYAQQVVFDGTPRPAVVKVSVADGPDERVRLELPPDQARTLGLIVNDAARSGIKSVRALGKELVELSALVSEPEADELEAGA
jgi:hypothetical protein